MNRLFSLAAGLSAASLVLAACAPAATPTPGPVAAAGALGEVLQRGTLVVSTDPAYPPQSQLKTDGARTPNTRCASDQKTLGELEGFDVDVAAAVAQELGVEVCFVTPDWTLITSGGWAGRWDVSIGSMTITPERMEKLFFAQPYYAAPAAAFVHRDNTSFQTPADLSGRTVGVCAGCTYEGYLNGQLTIPGETINFAIANASLKTYDTDSTALEDLALGDGLRLDAVITALPTGQGFIADGKPLRQLGDPLYYEYLAPALDKAAPSDITGLRDRITEAIQKLHANGTLKTLAEKYYGADLATPASTFNLAGLGQK